ncbi:hypothetical protein [Wolbachia endosymbiont (group B) of Limnophora tigrina]|uniref:hypothetical protein n=1 Tax=Wolbachia endosymbiont (group B) of Limnophora tigrina TaxID=3139317 RepID=UPI0035B54675
MAEVKKNPIATLNAQAKEFDFSKLRADKNNSLANSGETMYLDFQRMNFVINGKEIDKNFIIALKEGAKDYKSELFSRGDIYNPESGKEREIDTEQGRAFIDSVLKELDQNRLPKIWDDHCNNPNTADHQKTDLYKKEFEKFYNIGKEYNHLLPKKGDENKNYRPFAKEIFKEMFEYAGAEVPSDPILEELITNCNQAGYGAGIFNEYHAALSSCSLTPHNPKKALNIYCIDHNHIKVKSDMAIPITTFDNPEEKICDLSSSLEFTLESQDGKDGVTYKDGKLSLTAPEELKNYQEGGKSLFDIIKEHFQKFCEQLGFKFETETQIKHNLENPLKVNSHLESVKPPVHVNENEHVHGGRGL